MAWICKRILVLLMGQKPTIKDLHWKARRINRSHLCLCASLNYNRDAILTVGHELVLHMHHPKNPICQHPHGHSINVRLKHVAIVANEMQQSLKGVILVREFILCLNIKLGLAKVSQRWSFEKRVTLIYVRVSSHMTSPNACKFDGDCQFQHQGLLFWFFHLAQ